MQRQEMIAQMIETLQEQSGGQGAPAKFRLSYHLNRAANDIAAKYKCLYGYASANLVANQVKYSAPTSTAETANVAVIEVYAVTAYDSAGVLHTMQPATIPGMDSSSPGWRSWGAGTCPSYAVSLGLTSFLLTPAPNYNSVYDPMGITPGGYTVEGPCIPGHSWDALTAECPLPTQIHEAVVALACLYRIVDRPTKENLARVDLLRDLMQSQLDTFESTVVRYTQATRVPAYTTECNAGATPALDFNPLDQ